MSKYIKTVTVYNEQQFDSMHPGQWFKWNNGARGQWQAWIMYATNLANLAQSQIVRIMH